MTDAKTQRLMDELVTLRRENLALRLSKAQLEDVVKQTPRIESLTPGLLVAYMTPDAMDNLRPLIGDDQADELRERGFVLGPVLSEGVTLASLSLQELAELGLTPIPKQALLSVPQGQPAGDAGELEAALNAAEDAAEAVTGILTYCRTCGEVLRGAARSSHACAAGEPVDHPDHPVGRAVRALAEIVLADEDAKRESQFIEHGFYRGAFYGCLGYADFDRSIAKAGDV